MSDSSPQQQKRWLMFLVRPADLLQLLRIVSNPISKFASGSLPPDVHAVDAFYDEGGNWLGAMLESEYFEPVNVERRGEMWAADAWPRAVFSLGSAGRKPGDEELWGEEDEAAAAQDEPAPQFFSEFQGAVERGLHLRALNFTPEDLLTILRAPSATALPIFPVYKEDTRLLGCVANEKINGWTLFLEHPDFDAAKLSQDEEMVYAEIEGDGHEMKFRFGLPGARLERKLDIDVSALQ